MPAGRDVVDQFFEGAPSPVPVECPDPRVPWAALPIEVGRVDDAEEILQAELPAVLGVVPRALDVEEEVARTGLRKGEQPAVGDERTVFVSIRIQQFVLDRSGVLARDLELRLQLRAQKRVAVDSLSAR